MKMTAVTFSFSRAIVHNDWMVYIELPSPISARTGRSGQAIAAPIAFGRPCPIAPPVSVTRSCRGEPAVYFESMRPEVIASSMRMAFSCSRWPTALHTFSAVSFLPRGAAGRAASASAGMALSAPTAIASFLRLREASCSADDSSCTAHVSGTR